MKKTSKRKKASGQKQLEFTTILEESFLAHERKLLLFMGKNVEAYRARSLLIKPDLTDRLAVYARISFAILSANAPFEDSVKALDVAVRDVGNVDAANLVPFKMVPAKASYVNEAWSKLNAFGYPLGSFLKRDVETWNDYRLRLKRTFRGLGLAKASFACCLLYPDTADVACIDTWVQKVFLGNTGFKSLNLETYLMVEARIRVYARKFQVSTFLAQWMLWNHARSDAEGNALDHDIFPGSHKLHIED